MGSHGVPVSIFTKGEYHGELLKFIEVLWFSDMVELCDDL